MESSQQTTDRESMIKAILQADATYKVIGRKFAYGTAGFRTLGDHLERVSFRAGILAGIRAKMRGLAGVMVTASHNPKQDNGLKIIENDGAMLEPAWEKLAEELVNTEDLGGFLADLSDGKIESFNLGINIFEQQKHSLVFIGQDTRESSQRLADAVTQGVTLIGSQPRNFGLVSTPQLHWLVQKCKEIGYDKFEQIQTIDYNNAWVNCYKDFQGLVSSDPKKYEKKLFLDCANGVGSIQFKKILESGLTELLDVEIVNDDLNPDKLNEDCGAEFVHKDQKLPLNFDEKRHKGVKCASFDGDADRLIYYYQNEEGKLVIIDGDKQFAFIVMYIKSLLEKLDLGSKLTHVLVQTAYVNSRATQYLIDQKVHNELCPTGVKNAHPIVVKYDIGANDEPNGHGTVVCKWDKVNEALGDKKDTVEGKKLVSILRLSNMTVGDAIANLLLLESIMRDLDFSIQDFANIYEENPSRMYKAIVSDRTKFKTIWDEARLTHPIELQQKIDELVASVNQGKAFVRPSGTEDILRLYSEAKTMEEMEHLAKEILAEIETKYKNF